LEIALAEEPRTDMEMQKSIFVKKWHDDPLFCLHIWSIFVIRPRWSDSKAIGALIDLLVAIVDRFANLTGRKHIASTFWRSECLRGMFRHLRRAGGSFRDAEKYWRKFVGSLISRAIPSADLNPSTKRLLKGQKADRNSFKVLGQFLKTGKDLWTGGYDFPLSLIREPHGVQLAIKRLLETGSKFEKRCGLMALRCDLREQQREYIEWVHQHHEAVEVLEKLVLDLGDRELAQEVDEKLPPPLDSDRSLLARLDRRERIRSSQVRRKDAKKRRKKLAPT
jgi:hypothetical protein